ncbi:MAG: hypothetical protein A2Y03_00830 [Omnitrophica WOR_2 bacterium GWF2_38_59]|nr:MAG: hypothetical protein A2Y03_00830 [Omnitrophica WOR_2 bacterium GWF2_38_59]OGX46900.1 MAG: hypothetical protein A2243_11950 [Omnitrophica WOR_2 bacterium RIFOXYA2_FULL_38_17]OGX52592.1 MAG: hypothetical protein A2267_03740 [Omnitrophica WOR_2 bacterium RIFOXYA12_FULL_38_10]OGX58519.1 MAG: hypothetical protein A2306_03785 [Omnitrophica WOR_2 bacterium RIFOXYB2_FULL_38_16]HBG60602.1 hypothetical protein [Candidatus Omnitrophota bacterium]
MKSLLRALFITLLTSTVFCLIPNVSHAKVKIGSGWSVNIEESKAANEAIQMLKRTIPNPDFIYLMVESEYDKSIIIEQLRETFKDAKLFGLEVSFAVFTQEGIHKGEKGSLAMLGIEAPSWKIGLGIADMSQKTTMKDIKEITSQTIISAVKDAGKSISDKPSFILISPAKLKEQPILEAIEEFFGHEIKLMGGTPANSTVFSNNNVIDGGFALAVFYADSKVGVGYHSGVRIDKKLSGIVTETGPTNKHLKMIDNLPAFDVYNEWSGGLFNNIDINALTAPLAIWETAGRIPIVKIHDLGEEKTVTTVTLPTEIYPDKTLLVGIDMKVGDRIYYPSASRKGYIIRAGTIITKALIDGRVKKNTLAGGIHVYSRSAAFGQIGRDPEELQKIVFEMKKEMNGKPFIGGFTSGEQGNIKGYGCFHGSLSSAMIVFGDE